MDSVGSGVAYTSAGGWSALGIGGLSGLGDCGAASSSPVSPFLQRLKKLILRGIAEKETRPEGRREGSGWSRVKSSSFAKDSGRPKFRVERAGSAGGLGSLIRTCCRQRESMHKNGSLSRKKRS